MKSKPEQTPASKRLQDDARAYNERKREALDAAERARRQQREGACPVCSAPAPKAPQEVSGSSLRWFTCRHCGHDWPSR